MMKKERRNYYRLLHVQPEAPSAIITASYRGLMTKLRCHPDLGGNHETAALINQAYTVLKDPEKRKAYDRTLNGAPRQERSEHQPSPAQSDASTRRHWNRSCPFCADPVPRIVSVLTRCNRCDSPLAPIANRLSGKRELLGQRFSPRVSKADTATLYPGWGRPSVSARLRDLSPTGISVFAGTTLAPGVIVRVVAPSYDFLASVVQVRPRDRIQIIHARLVTAWFAKKSAVFVSMSV
jgi:curved DNA-binding protein CbpA